MTEHNQELSCVYIDLSVSGIKLNTHDIATVLSNVNAALLTHYGIQYVIKQTSITKWSATVDPVSQYLCQEPSYNIKFVVKKEKIVTSKLTYKNVKVDLDTVTDIGHLSLRGIIVTGTVSHFKQLRDNVLST